MIPLVHRRSRHPPIRRFDEDGNPTPEALAEQARVPHASPAVTRVSGISDAMATNPIGKMISAFLLGTFRSWDVRRLSRLKAVMELPSGARVYRETNGKGHAFYRVRYRYRDPLTHRSRQRSLYLGCDPDLAAWAREILQERLVDEQRNEPPGIDIKRLENLRKLNRKVSSTAQGIAARSGFGFRGTRLVRHR